MHNQEDGRFNALMTDVIDGLWEEHRDALEDTGTRIALVDAGRRVYRERAEVADDFGNGRSDYAALRDAVETSLQEMSRGHSYH